MRNDNSTQVLNLLLHCARCSGAFAQISKEVSVEYGRYASKQSRVDAISFEDVVYVGSFAIEVTSKPCHASLLSLKFFANEFSYVYWHKQVFWYVCLFKITSPKKKLTYIQKETRACSAVPEVFDYLNNHRTMPTPKQRHGRCC